MENYNKKEILHHFLNDGYEQIFCEKCMNTFLTNVYEFDEGHVLLEKRALGLEYFCHAIHKFGLSIFPELTRIGVLDEDGNIISLPPEGELFSEQETEYRYIYLMEKLEHLGEKDSQLFDECIKDLDWKDEKERSKALEKVGEIYSSELQHEIELLFSYYETNKDYILWDLHGDNLMKRPATGKILILDPFAMSV